MQTLLLACLVAVVVVVVVVVVAAAAAAGAAAGGSVGEVPQPRQRMARRLHLWLRAARKAPGVGQEFGQIGLGRCGRLEWPEKRPT